MPATNQHPPKMLTISNGQTITSTKTPCLQLNNLPQKGTTAYCLPNMHNNLLAFSKLYDAGCYITFDRNGVIVQYEGVIVLHMPSHLWQVPIINSIWISPLLSHDTNQYLLHTDHIINNISKHICNCKGTPQINKFYHATIFSPAKTILLEAIKKGYLWGCPEFTYQSAKQHIIHNESATVKGHTNQQCHGTQSTKFTPTNMHPVHDYTYFATTDTTSIIHTNQTGKFLMESSCGYKYVMISYSCNATLAHPIKNRLTKKLLKAHQDFYTILHNAELSLHMHKLDNETLADIEHCIANHKCSCSICSPG